MAFRAVCALCKSNEGKMNAVGEKGLRRILRAGYEKQEYDIYERLMILKDKSSPHKFIYFIYSFFFFILLFLFFI